MSASASPIADVFLGDVQEASTGGSAARFTQYEVCTIGADGVEYVAWRRFSEFERLATDLRLKSVPFALPKLFWQRFDDDLINKRKLGLESYLRAVVGECAGAPPRALVRFLGMPDAAASLPPVAEASVGAAGWAPGGVGVGHAQAASGGGGAGADGGGGGGSFGRGSKSTGATPGLANRKLPSTPGGATGANGGAGAGGAAEEEAAARAAAAVAPAVKIEGNDTVIVVAIVLPVHIVRVNPPADASATPPPEGGYQWDLRWDDESIIGRPQLSDVISAAQSVTWVGCPAWTCGCPEEEDSLLEALELELGCHAWVPPADARRGHSALCRRVIWPLLHNQTLNWAGRRDELFTDAEWRAYCLLNKKMADKVLEVAEPDSMIWVHDYHLLLLPSYLIRKLPVANVGLSLHTPFPSSDTFRALSVREELLRAMLNADLVHFHLFEYARNFLACCKRMLGLEFEFQPGGFLGVECSGRHTMVAVSCAGISPPVILPHVEPVAAALRAYFAAGAAGASGGGGGGASGGGGGGGAPSGAGGPAAAALRAEWPEIAAQLDSLGAKLPVGGSSRAGGQRVQLIVGMDEVERLKGVPLKLHSFRQMLREHTELRGRVMLAQVCLLQRQSVAGAHSLSTQAALDGGATGLDPPGRTSVGSRQGSAEVSVPPSPRASGAEVAGPAMAYFNDAVLDDINELVAELNSEFPGCVHTSFALCVPPQKRVALWAAASVALFTAVREGLNLNPLEVAFVAGELMAKLPRGAGGGGGGARPSCAGGGGPRQKLPAALVVSENSPASLTLNGAYRINPWSKEKTATTLERALSSDEGVRTARAAKDYEYAAQRTAERWAAGVVADIKKMRRSDAGEWTAVGFGLNVRMVGMGMHFQPLNTAAVTKAYRASENRLIFLDWGGTLIPLDLPFYDARTDKGAAPAPNGAASAASPPAGGGSAKPAELLPQSTLSTLSGLASDKSNFLMVLSGLTRDKVDAAFGSERAVACAAEHGYWYRTKDTAGWQTNHAGRPMTWYNVAAAILDVYTQRTAGTFVKKKGVSLTWKYEDADPEFGAMMAKELHHHLSQVLSAWNDVAVHTGKGYLEVQPRDINKGTMVDFMCSRVTQLRGTPPDFILCIGDDSADEFMFSALSTRYAASEETALFTCTVGRKPSTASFYLSDHERVVELLSSMRMQSAGVARFHSVSANLGVMAGGGLDGGAAGLPAAPGSASGGAFTVEGAGSLSRPRQRTTFNEA